MVAIGWLILMAVLLVIEIATLGLTTIWFAAGALAGFIVAVVDLPIWLQIAVFIVVSVILLIFTRPLATRYLNSKTSKTNAESLVGRSAKVTKAINNIQAEGQVVVGGMEWTARSTDDAVLIPVGAIVTIRGISGVKLIVCEKKEGTENE